MNSNWKSVRIAALWLFAAGVLLAQRPPAEPASPRDIGAPPNVGSAPSVGTEGGPPDWRLSQYVLGPGDEISIRIIELEGVSDSLIRVGSDGTFDLPMAGLIRASGLTTRQLAAELTRRLSDYMREPQVSVSVTDFRSQPVSVIGAVKKPGVHQVQGRKTLVEILSLAEGLRDDAGHRIKITRRLEWGRIPIQGASDDPTGRYSVAEVSLSDVMEGENPEQNVFIMPHDVISVPRAEMIYVVGAVKRAGGFVLKERETISALQALALAGGLDKKSSAKNARILRPAQGGEEPVELAINLKKVMAGKSSDLLLRREDILFVPRSGAKVAAAKAADAALRTVSGLLIWRR